MFCEQCGTQIETESSFCHHCGNMLKQEASITVNLPNLQITPKKKLQALRIKEDFLSFKGRLNRKPAIMRSMVLLGVNLAVMLLLTLSAAMEAFVVSSIIMLLAIPVQLLTLISGLSLSVRRAHDLDKAWTYLLWNLVPIAGLFIGYKLLCIQGTSGPNKFGNDPLENAN